MKLMLAAFVSLFAQNVLAYSAVFHCMDQKQPQVRIVVDIGNSKASIQAPGLFATYPLTSQHDFLPTHYEFGTARDCMIEFEISGDRHSGTAHFRCSPTKYPQAAKFQNLPCWLND